MWLLADGANGALTILHLRLPARLNLAKLTVASLFQKGFIKKTICGLREVLHKNYFFTSFS